MARVIKIVKLLWEITEFRWSIRSCDRRHRPTWKFDLVCIMQLEVRLSRLVAAQTCFNAWGQWTAVGKISLMQSVVRTMRSLLPEK